MILSGPEIIKVINRTRKDRADGAPQMLPAIDIEPFTIENVGPNSVDLTLGDTLVCYAEYQYESDGYPRTWLDCRKLDETYKIEIPPSGLVLEPLKLYLGNTVENTTTHGIVPCVETRSSLARKGLMSHLSAGFGDDGFEGTWTLEIVTMLPIRVYAGMRIAQVAFTTMLGERQPYKGKYLNQSAPTASKLHEDKR